MKTPSETLNQVAPETPTAEFRPRKPRQSPARLWLLAGWFVLLFAIAVALQWKSGAYSSELAHFPDEPSHVVTSLMIHDYVAAGAAHQSPLAYADAYYIHYPKVAMGIWPPVFHTALALWIFIASDTRTSLLLAMAFQTALLGLAVSSFSLRFFRPLVAFLIGAATLCMPIVQGGGSMVMVDTAVGLWEFAALYFLIQYFNGANPTRAAVFFGVCTAIGLLTKGNAGSLIFVPPFLILLTRRFYLLTRPGLYIAGLLVLLIAMPWQYVTWSLIQSSLLVTGSILAQFRERAFGYVKILYDAGGPVLFLFAMIGLTAEIVQTLREPREQIRFRRLSSAGAVSLLLAIWYLHVITPIPGPDNRYMLPAIPLLVLFCAFGIHRTASWLPWPDRVPTAWRRPALAFLTLLVFLATSFEIPSRPALGFLPAIQYLMRQKPGITLVVSDPTGEGATVVEVALRDTRPQRIVLRGTKVLSTTAWSGGDPYRPLLPDTKAVNEYLDNIGVDSILVDLSPDAGSPDRDRVVAAITGNPKWHIALESKSAGMRPVQLFRRTIPVPFRKGEIRLKMPYTLGHDLVL